MPAKKTKVTATGAFKVRKHVWASEKPGDPPIWTTPPAAEVAKIENDTGGVLDVDLKPGEMLTIWREAE